MTVRFSVRLNRALLAMLLAFVLFVGGLAAAVAGASPEKEPSALASPACCPWAYVVYPADSGELLDALYQFNLEGRPYELSVDNGNAYLYYSVHGGASSDEPSQ